MGLKPPRSRCGPGLRLGVDAAEWAPIEKASALPPPRVHPAWVMTKLEHLDALLRRDPQRAKVEILKHLDGDLVTRDESPDILEWVGRRW